VVPEVLPKDTDGKAPANPTFVNTAFKKIVQSGVTHTYNTAQRHSKLTLSNQLRRAGFPATVCLDTLLTRRHPAITGSCTSAEPTLTPFSRKGFYRYSPIAETKTQTKETVNTLVRGVVPDKAVGITVFAETTPSKGRGRVHHLTLKIHTSATGEVADNLLTSAAIALHQSEEFGKLDTWPSLQALKEGQPPKAKIARLYLNTAAAVDNLTREEHNLKGVATLAVHDHTAPELKDINTRDRTAATVERVINAHALLHFTHLAELQPRATEGKASALPVIADYVGDENFTQEQQDKWSGALNNPYLAGFQAREVQPLYSAGAARTFRTFLDDSTIVNHLAQAGEQLTFDLPDAATIVIQTGKAANIIADHALYVGVPDAATVLDPNLLAALLTKILNGANESFKQLTTNTTLVKHKDFGEPTFAAAFMTSTGALAENQVNATNVAGAVRTAGGAQLTSLPPNHVRQTVAAKGVQLVQVYAANVTTLYCAIHAALRRPLAVGGRQVTLVTSAASTVGESPTPTTSHDPETDVKRLAVALDKGVPLSEVKITDFRPQEARMALGWGLLGVLGRKARSAETALTAEVVDSFMESFNFEELKGKGAQDGHTSPPPARPTRETEGAHKRRVNFTSDVRTTPYHAPDPTAAHTTAPMTQVVTIPPPPHRTPRRRTAAPAEQQTAGDTRSMGACSLDKLGSPGSRRPLTGGAASGSWQPPTGGAAPDNIGAEQHQPPPGVDVTTMMQPCHSTSGLTASISTHGLHPSAPLPMGTHLATPTSVHAPTATHNTLTTSTPPNNPTEHAAAQQKTQAARSPNWQHPPPTPPPAPHHISSTSNHRARGTTMETIQEDTWATEIQTSPPRNPPEIQAGNSSPTRNVHNKIQDWGNRLTPLTQMPTIIAPRVFLGNTRYPRVFLGNTRYPREFLGNTRYPRIFLGNARGRHVTTTIPRTIEADTPSHGQQQDGHSSDNRTTRAPPPHQQPHPQSTHPVMQLPPHLAAKLQKTMHYTIRRQGRYTAYYTRTSTEGQIYSEFHRQVQLQYTRIAQQRAIRAKQDQQQQHTTHLIGGGNPTPTAQNRASPDTTPHHAQPNVVHLGGSPYQGNQLVPLEPWDPNSHSWLSGEQLEAAMTAIVEAAEIDSSLDLALTRGTLCTGNIIGYINDATHGNPVRRRDSPILRDMRDPAAPTMYPFSDDMHWRAVLLCPMTETMYAYDPYGTGFTNTVLIAMQNLVRTHNDVYATKWNIQEITIRMQTDGYQCGIWVLHTLDIWTMHQVEMRTQETFEKDFQTTLRNSLPPNQQNWPSYIQSKRETYSTYLGDYDATRAAAYCARIMAIQRPPQYAKRPVQRRLAHKPARPARQPQHADTRPPTNALTDRANQHRAQPAHKRQEPNNTTARTKAPRPNPPASQLQKHRTTHKQPAPAPDGTLRQQTITKLISRKDAIQQPQNPPPATNTDPAPAHKPAPNNKRKTQPHITDWATTKATKQPPTTGAHTTPGALPRKPTPHQQTTPPQQETTQPQQTQLLKIITTNVQGAITSSELIGGTIAEQQPDVIILTETQMVAKQHRNQRMHQALDGYEVYHSHKPDNPDTSKGQGVAVAIKQYFTRTAHLQIQYPTLPEQEGQWIHITVSRSETPKWHIVGVYAPPSLTSCERKKLYASLRQQILDPSRKQQETVLIAGDWNATLHQHDRGSHNEYPADIQHREFIQAADLHNLDDKLQQDRQPTFIGPGGTGVTSRIDDMYIQPMGDVQTWTDHAQIVLRLTGDTTDHHALVTNLHAPDLGICLPTKVMPPEKPAQKQLVRPITKANKTLAKQAVEQGICPVAHNIQAGMQQIMTTDIRPHLRRLKEANADGRTVHKCSTLLGRPAKEVVEEKAAKVEDVLQEVQRIIENTCPTTTVKPGAMHCLPKKVSKQRKLLIRKGAVAHALLDHIHIALQRPDQEWNWQATIDEVEQEMTHPDTIDERWTQNHIQYATTRVLLDAQDRDRSRGLCDDPETATLLLRRLKKEYKDRIRWIDNEHTTHQQQQRNKRRRAILDLKPRLGHKMVTVKTATNKAKGDLLVLKNAQGQMVTAPEHIKAAVHEFYSNLQAAPAGVKTGEYLPGRATRNYPWEAEGAVDKFKLATLATEQAHRPLLHHKIMDKIEYDLQVKALSKGKAAGPDAIMNETLQLLPEVMHRNIHDLFVIMWATGITPTLWKTSNTILLYKDKESPLDLANYRPIGLANTLYKLWTRMVTSAIYDTAERTAMLSHTQAGFRTKRSTDHQLQMLVMALEDARRTNQDIFLLMIDFKSAFNMPNHDKMLMIMYDLGLPTDAIEIVKDLYNDAVTSYITPHGSTAEVPIHRGTLQGDSLSPLLFLLYIEPLLRWLHVGARGYQFGSLPKEDKVTHQCSSFTFADDLNAPTSTLTNAQLQGGKITGYSNWGNMEVSETKTTIAAMLGSATLNYHKYKTNNPAHGPTIARILKGAITIQGKTIRHLQPYDKQKCLGVTFTMGLDWRPQYTEMMTKARETLHRIVYGWASPTQKVHMINTLVKPQITYPSGIAPYTTAQLKAIDSMLDTAVKKALGQKRSMATALVREDIDAFGLGRPSLMVDYAQANARALTEALNQTGSMATITAALLQAQLDDMGHAQTTDLPQLANYTMRARQLTLMHSIDGMQLFKAKCEQFTFRGTELGTLVKVIWPATTEQGRHTLPLAKMHPLLKLGIADIHQLMEPDTRRMQAYKSLKILHKDMNRRHKRVLQELTQLLHDGPDPANPTPNPSGNTNTQVARTIHPAYYAIIERQAKLAPAPPPRNPQLLITQLLVAETRQREPAPCPAAARDILRQHAEAQTLKHTMPTHQEPAKRPALRRGVKAKTTITKNKKPQQQVKRTSRHAQMLAMMEEAQKLKPGKERTKKMRESAKKVEEEMGDEGTPLNMVAELIACQMLNKPNPSRAWTERQEQILVRWEPTPHIELWRIKNYETMGYTALTATQVMNPAHSMDTICELCRKTTNAANMNICDGCGRGFHTGCANGHSTMHAKCVLTQEEQESNDWPDGMKWYCMECTPYLDTTDGNNIQPGPQLAECPHVLGSRIYRVEWEDSWEPIASLRPTHDVAISKLHSQQDEVQPTTRPDEHWPDLWRQGCHPAQRSLYDKTVGDEIRQRVRLHTDPINPHMDIRPTGKYRIELRQVDSYKRQKDETNYTHNGYRELACIYAPDGKLVDTLEPRRLAILYKNYKNTDLRQEIRDQLEVKDFATEVALLILRYKEGAEVEDTPGATKSRTKITVKNHWAVPTAVMQTLRKWFNLSKERFASPLNCDPGMEYYFSLHARDQVFGAAHNSYSYRWEHASEANPEYEDDEMYKSMRWAVHSALQCAKEDVPSLTLFILPACDESKCTGYERWNRTCPGTVKEVMRIPKNMFKFRKPTSWLDSETYAGNPKWDVKILMVANKLGQEKYCHLNSWDTYAEFEDEMKDALQAICPDQKVKLEITTKQGMGSMPLPPRAKIMDDKHTMLQMQTAETEQMGMRCPKGLRLGRAQSDTAHNMGRDAAKLNRRDTTKVAHDPNLPLDTLLKEVDRGIKMMRSQECAQPSELAHNWKTMAYTDGSAQTKPDAQGNETTITGAAVYYPDMDTGLEGYTDSINPGQTGVTHTNNRAEGVALLRGIKELGRRQKQAICTDSLVNMLLIRKALYKPQDLRYNLHNKLMQAVVSAIEEREEPLDIYKVASHIGVIGNEMADTGAKAAANGEYGITMLDGAEPYDDVYWPRAQVPVPTPPQAKTAKVAEQQPGAPQAGATTDTNQHSQEEQIRTKEITPANLGKAIKQLSHRVHRLGAANMDTVYGKAWTKILPRTERKTSNLFVNSSKITTREKKIVRQYRYGGLPTQTFLHRCNLAPSPACLLCGAPADGNHHALSGCRAMTEAVTERHNGAARIIAKAVTRGRVGARVVMADIGNPDKQAADDITRPAPATVPAKLWPTGWLDAQIKEAQATYKPDLLIQDHSTEAKSKIALTVVEIKYCRDTDPEYQLEHAQDQHADFREKMEQAGHEVTQVNITLGVGGTVYKDTTTALKALGVTAVATTLSDLHYYSAKWVNKMWNIRQHKVRTQRWKNSKAAKATATREEREGGHAWQQRHEGPDRAPETNTVTRQPRNKGSEKTNDGGGGNERRRETHATAAAGKRAGDQLQPQQARTRQRRLHRWNGKPVARGQWNTKRLRAQMDNDNQAQGKGQQPRRGKRSRTELPLLVELITTINKNTNNKRERAWATEAGTGPTRGAKAHKT
jgi:exonuclease III/ribonuclease HI